MRLALVTEAYPPAVGGAERLLHCLVTELGRRGHWIDIITPTEGALPPNGQGTVHRVPGRVVAGGVAAQPKWIRSKLADCGSTVVITSGPSMLEVCTVLSGVGPIVSLYQGHLALDKRSSQIAQRVHARWVIRRVAEVVVWSERTSHDLQGKWPNRTPTVVVPGVLSTAESQRRRDGKIGVEPRLLFVGRLPLGGRQKRPDRLIEAAARLQSTYPQIQVDVVGDGPGQGELRHLAQSKGISEHVRLHGRVDDDELSDLYDRADVLVLPSPDRSEGFGLVLQEAIAHDLPTVMSSEAGGAEFLRRTGCGALYDPFNPESLDGAIRKAIEMATGSNLSILMAEARRLSTCERMTSELLSVISRAAPGEV